MWIVAKIKKKELHIFKKELSKEFGVEIKFYNPKIQYQKYIKNKIKKRSILQYFFLVFCIVAPLLDTLLNIIWNIGIKTHPFFGGWVFKT